MFGTCQASGGDDKICVVISSSLVCQFNIFTVILCLWRVRFEVPLRHIPWYSNLEADNTQRWFEGMFWQSMDEDHPQTITNPWNHVGNCWRQATLLEILDPEQNTTFKASGIAVCGWSKALTKAMAVQSPRLRNIRIWSQLDPVCPKPHCERWSWC